MNKVYTLLACIAICWFPVSAQYESFADRWEFAGVAVEEPGYTIWGTSSLLGEDGMVHLFVARWPRELKVDPGWRSHSEIAHYVGESPERPFRFSDVAIMGTGKDAWDRYGVHNPAFFQHPDGGFFLYFKSAEADMGLAVAEQAEGPYIQLPFPVTANQRRIEDGYAFLYEGKIALLTKNNHGILEEGGGLIWTSSDGIHFNDYRQGFKRISQFTDIDMTMVAVIINRG